jgi:glutathione S-transferase
MLTFYYHPLSPIARRVWLALLEREIPFQLALVDLSAKAQHQSDYLALNPFHHVPVIVDNDLRILESLAILDYLEEAYPQRSLMPREPQAIAKMRMVQLVTTNELMPKLPRLLVSSELSNPDPDILHHLATVLNFFVEQLGDNHYFGGDVLSLADITAGATLPLIQRFGFNFHDHHAVADWHERLMARPAWQQTEPNDADFEAWKRWMSLMIKRHQRHQVRALTP